MNGLLEQFLSSTYLFWYALISAIGWWVITKGRSHRKLNWGLQWFLIFIMLPCIILGVIDHLLAQ